VVSKVKIENLRGIQNGGFFGGDLKTGWVEKTMAITIGCGIQMPNYFQGINISHLGKRKIIFKIPFLGDMLVPWRITTSRKIKTYGCEQKLNFPGLPMQKYANMFFFLARGLCHFSVGQ